MRTRLAQPSLDAFAQSLADSYPVITYVDWRNVVYRPTLVSGSAMCPMSWCYAQVADLCSILMISRGP